MSQQTPVIRSNASVGTSTMSDRADLSNLFAERSLWAVFRSAKPFYHNRFNCTVAIVGAVLMGAFASLHFVGLGALSANRIDFRSLFSTWMNTGISYGGTILGFLLAGFAVLFAVLRPQTVLALQQIKRPGERFDELKLMFVTFVDVFVHYAAFLFWCVAYLVAGAQNGPFDLIGRWLSAVSPTLPSVITHVAFFVWGMWFLILVLKLKSFVFNLYQILLLGMADSLE